MVLSGEGPSRSSTVAMRTPERRPSRATATTATSRTVGRSRRRRPMATPSSASSIVAADDTGDKENYRSHRSRRRTNTTTTTPMRGSRETNLEYVHDDDDGGSTAFGTEKTLCSSSSSIVTPPRRIDTINGIHPYEAAVRDFRKALPNTSVLSSLWSDYPDLPRTLVKISLSRSCTTDSLCLDGHASALMSLSRKLIRNVALEASGSSNANGSPIPTSLENNLLVAVHILRSMAFCLSDAATNERKEALLKMFFHLISSTHSERRRNKHMERCKWIALAGYEGLAKVLSNYSIQQKTGDGKDKVVSFSQTPTEFGTETDANQRIVSVVPSAMRRKKTNSDNLFYKAGSMSVRQLSTIVFQTTMIVAKAMLSMEDGLTLPYGNAGTILLGKLENGGEARSCRWQGAALELLQRIHGPWLMLLASTSVNERETAKEVLSYSKGIHRMLWDAASTLKSTSNSAPSVSRRVELDCLGLRKRAILHLLASTGTSKLDLLIRRTSFESGCNYAWKAASVFAKNLSSDFATGESLLTRFYEDLGSAFARMILLDPKAPLGFVEYKAHRALHMESITSFSAATSAPNLDDFGIEEDEILNGNYRVLLHLLDLGNQCKMKIRAFTSSGHHQVFSVENKSETSNWMPFFEKTVLAFREQVIHRMDRIPSDVSNRILKVLCNLSLHKTLFLALKFFDAEGSSSTSILELEIELLTAATILTECLGPLISVFLNQSPNKAPQLIDLMMECFLRPLSLYEQLCAPHVNTKESGRVLDFEGYLESSMKVCKRMTEILTDDSPRSNDFIIPLHCLEKAAKSLYGIARRRNERSQMENSLPPLLYSLQLYDNLDKVNGLKKDYQLSSRLYLLSSTLQSMDKMNESFFISCLLVHYESDKRYSPTSTEATTDEHLLNFLGAKSCGLLPPSTDDAQLLPQIIRSLCRQMATSLMKSEAYKEPEALCSYSQFTIGSAMESILEEKTGNAATIQAPHPLESIQRLLPFDRNVNHEAKMMLLFSVIEILVQSGRSIQQLSGDLHFCEFQFENSLHNYFVLYGLLRRAIANLDLESPTVCNGLLGLVASGSMVPSFSMDLRNDVNLQLAETAIEIANESIKNLKLEVNHEVGMDWMLLSEGLRLVLRNLAVILQREVAETNSDDDLFNDCISVMESLVNAERRMGKCESNFLRASHWIIWVATNLQNKFEIRCDHDRVAIFSSWILSLAEKIEPYQPWFRALVMTTCANGSNPLHLKKKLDVPSSHNHISHGSALWIFEKELQLCEIRIAVFQCLEGGKVSFRTQMQKVEEVLAELEESTVEKSEDLFVLYTWVLSTAYLVQTDIASAFGYFTTALKTSQMCQKCCQTVLKRGSHGPTNVDEWMASIATSTVSAMVVQRYIEILSKKPKLHYRLGDHRKAIAYTRSILEYLKIDPASLTSCKGRGHEPKDLADFLEAAPQGRLFLQMNGWASAPETTMKFFSGIKSSDLNRHRSDDVDKLNVSIIHSVEDLIAIGDLLYGDSLSEQFQRKFCAFYQEAATLMAQRPGNFQLRLYNMPLEIEQHLGMPVINQVKLRDVRRLLDTSHESNRESNVTIRRLCSQIKESEFSCPEEMAWSLYYLGVMELDAARCSGALQKLWDKKEWDQTSFPIAYNDRNIQSARHHLSRALLYSSHASEIFARNTLRCLALAEGPRIRNGVAASAGILILRSIGQTIRRKLTLSFDQNDEWLEIEPFKNMKDIFGVFDGQNKPDKEMDEKIQLFLSELAARTPKDWGFVAPVICPSGELLVSIIQKTDPNSNEFTISTKCIFPPAGENAYDIIVKPLDTILARVEQQLKGVDPSLVSTSDDKETIKRKWWNERNCLDEEMRELLEDVESLYFSKVFDIPSDEDTSISSISSTNFEGLPRGNLTSRFEAAVNDGKEFRCDSEEDLEKKIDAMMKSTVPKLKDRLLSAGASKSQLRKLRKADLIELLIQIERDNQDDEIVEATVNECNSNESNNCDKCLFLVLDENLHRFPFEGMPVLKGKTVCRIPCLSFVLATLVERGDSPMIFPSVDPANVSYILNPENNLQATQDRLLPAIEGVASSRRCDWECVIGEIPPASFFFESFRRKDGLTMYFGHGGAQVCFSRRSVEELIEHRASSVPLNALESETETSPCRSTVLLMGCSSGKLVSVNRKHSDSIEETPLYYEPEGVALSYLCAGAPCVIGNLWDVTDNDIDRFSISLLNDFFDNQRSHSLAKSLSVSRSVCKLKYLVGCAPVCYGVPVYLQHD